MRVYDDWTNKKTGERKPNYGRGKRWVVAWKKTPGAHDSKRSFRLKDEATAFLADRMAGLPLPEEVEAERLAAEREQAQADAQRLTFAQMFESWLRRQVHLDDRSRTIYRASYANALAPALADKLLADIDRLAVQDVVVAGTEAGRAANTVRQDYTLLHAVLQEAVLSGHIAKDPCVKIKLPTVVGEKIVPLTDEQVQEIVDAMRPPFAAAAVVVAATALRSGEWRGVIAPAVDVGLRILRVERQQVSTVQTKSVLKPKLKSESSRRHLAIEEHTLKVLTSLMQKPGPDGLLFHTGDGRIITQGLAQAEWDRVAAGGNSDGSRGEPRPWMGAGWHQLRHYHASRLIKAGASPVAVAHRLGHKDATVTLRTYAHLWPDDDRLMATTTDGLVKLKRQTNDRGASEAA
ncbi:hypothetical protein DWB68_10375 [Galactobacter valiniphilus]|uniref:Site-specific integrase n=1 Tax=Galactobacter valiniphilus TaxID=2676122 RepID=A0A399J8L9_9MICC|nr:site-specific integrase [Galactobacter valiniphilus]RII41923.1 hypothetical protein DWB68_10375 [Galactobacter valiniphilus]